MSKEKQIEEMAKIAYASIEATDMSYFGIGIDEVQCNAEAHSVAQDLYNAGYRKQSEGEWIDKPTGAYRRMQSWCSACGKHSGIGGIESNRHKPFCPNCGSKMKGGEE